MESSAKHRFRMLKSTFSKLFAIFINFVFLHSLTPLCSQSLIALHWNHNLCERIVSCCCFFLVHCVLAGSKMTVQPKGINDKWKKKKPTMYWKSTSIRLSIRSKEYRNHWAWKMAILNETQVNRNKQSFAFVCPMQTSTRERKRIVKKMRILSNGHCRPKTISIHCLSFSFNVQNKQTEKFKSKPKPSSVKRKYTVCMSY